jgi:hypothetical protein
MRIVLLIHAAVTAYMVGLIWFVQVVHYPLFGRIDEKCFTACQHFHLGRVTWVVGPPMLVEAFSAFGLLWADPSSWFLKLGAMLLILIWWSTWFLQVPKHNVLAAGYDSAALRHLVTWNWVRTVAWTLRAVVAFGLLL